MKSKQKIDRLQRFFIYWPTSFFILFALVGIFPIFDLVIFLIQPIIMLLVLVVTVLSFYAVFLGIKHSCRALIILPTLFLLFMFFYLLPSPEVHKAMWLFVTVRIGLISTAVSYCCVALWYWLKSRKQNR